MESGEAGRSCETLFCQQLQQGCTIHTGREMIATWERTGLVLQPRPSRNQPSPITISCLATNHTSKIQHPTTSNPTYDIWQHHNQHPTSDNSQLWHLTTSTIRQHHINIQHPTTSNIQYLAPDNIQHLTTSKSNIQHPTCPTTHIWHQTTST